MKKARGRRRAAADTDLLAALALLDERRAPYAELLAGIVADALARFPPAPGQPLLEIGAGAGQLRRWLPPAARARALHSDPSRRALLLLSDRAPEAALAAATAQQLPIGDGRCGAVLGLCVFDAIHAEGAEAAVTGELARVLPPGGRFLHFLDMATLLETPFAKLAAAGLVPIPNLFGDPADHEWPLDILLLQRDWLAGLIALGLRTGHAAGPALERTFATFLAQPFDTAVASNAFKAVAGSGSKRHALALLLASAGTLAARHGYPPLQPLPFHSGRYLRSVLETAFRDSSAFAIELAQILTRSMCRPRPGGASVRYQSLCVGHQRILDALPARRLTPAAAAPAADEVLVEAGLFVFVARRL